MVISYFSTYYKNQHFPAVGSNVIAIAKEQWPDFSLSSYYIHFQQH